jgi:hypothetical protein
MKYVIVDYNQQDYYGYDCVYVASFDTLGEAMAYIKDNYMQYDLVRIFIKKVA